MTSDNLTVALDQLTQELQRRLFNSKVCAAGLSTIAKNGNDKLVEKFLTENVFVQSGKGDGKKNSTDALQENFYLACFWGFADVARSILELVKTNNLKFDIDLPNKTTYWTPLHAATFQEHGPVVMLLLQQGAPPHKIDSDGCGIVYLGRSAVDFASASAKIWSHFAAMGLTRTPRVRLVQMGILRKSDRPSSVTRRPSSFHTSVPLAPFTAARPEENNNSRYAAMSGDVLARDNGVPVCHTPQFPAYR